MSDGIMTDEGPSGDGHDNAGPGRDRVIRCIRSGVAISTCAVLALLALFYAIDVLLLVFAGVLVALFLRALSDWISEHTPLSARWSLALVVLALAGLVALGLWLGGTRLAGQVDELKEKLPRAIEELKEWLEKTGWGRTLLDRLPATDELIPRRRDLLSRVGGAVSSTLGWLGDGLVVMFIGLFLAAEPGIYVNGLVRLVPRGRRERAREVLRAVGSTLRYWLLGKILAMALIGVVTTVGLWLLGLPLALTLGVLAALLTFIPNIGPVLSAVPAVLLALTQSPTRALYVVLLYIGVQVVESYLITPIVQRRTVSLPPGLTLTAQVLAGVLLGAMGLVLATPLAAALLVLVQMLYVQDVLGDPVSVAGQDG